MNDRSLDLCAIGLGQAGGFMAAEWRRRGYRAIALHTARADRRALSGRQPGLELGAEEQLDIAIDGADEIAPNLDLVKGLGGALVREKMTEVQAARLIIIADHTKLVTHLGEKAPLPIEILPFGFLSTIERLRRVLPGGRLRQPGAQPYVTDNGNYIFDAQLPETFEPAALERQLNGTLGVVDTGLFLGMAERAFVAAPDGVRELVR